MQTRLLLAASVLPFAFGDPQSRPAAPTKGEADFVFAILKSAPNAPTKSPEEQMKIQGAHLANIGRLAKEGSMLLAGPFGRPAPDPTARGVFLFDVATVAEAEKLTATDPAISEGLMIAESWPLRASASLRKIRDFEREAASTRPTPAPGAPPFGIRSYVLGLADDADAADRALAPLRAQGKVVAFGRFGGAKAGKALFVLLAGDIKEAEALLAPQKSAFGNYTLHPWLSADSAAKLAAPEGPASRKG